MFLAPHVSLALFLTHVLAQAPTAGSGLPDLSRLAANFPPGEDSNSPIVQIAIPAGPYQVNITEDSHFPNRTLYIPTGVAADTKVPIFAWENGMCYKFGMMYADFLREIASHGYFVVAPGKPKETGSGQTNKAWQTDSIDMALSWEGPPVKLDKSKIAIGGHSCGGIESTSNLASDGGKRITTAALLNTGTSDEALKKFAVPTLWVHGGRKDVAYVSENNFHNLVKFQPKLPAFKAVLDTGHLGSFYKPRGGIYAETVIHWFDWLLKGDKEAGAWFVGGEKSPAANRGWHVESNAI